MYALTEPVDEAALTAFIADSKATGKPWRQITTGLPRQGVTDVIGQLIPVVVPVAGLLVLLSLGGGSLVRAVWQFTFEAPFPLNLVIVGFLALIVFGVAIALVKVLKIIRSLGHSPLLVGGGVPDHPLRRGQRAALWPRRAGQLPGHHLRHRNRPDRRTPALDHRRPPGRDRQLPLHDLRREPR